MVIRLYNHQRAHKIDTRWLKALAKRALPDCLAAAKTDEAPLRTLTEIEVSVVTDETIAKVHADFLDDPAPTDVITFHHGEIIISADTAARQGAEHHQPLQHELALYLIHGLLHLAGWDDHDPAEQKEMHCLQDRILRASISV